MRGIFGRDGTVMTQIIYIAAALLVNSKGQALLVRKRGTTAFMQPGGKIEPSEAPVHALVRELEEELGLVIDPAAPVYLGSLKAPAANEPGHEVHCELFRVQTDAQVVPAAEIEEARWVEQAMLGELELAPLTRDEVLPVYFLQ